MKNIQNLRNMLMTISARVSAIITSVSVSAITVFADQTAPNTDNGDVSSGINFITWLGTVFTDYAWAIAVIALIPLAITFFLGGQEASEKGKHKAFNICLGIFVLCCGNMLIQAARASFGA